MSSETPCRILAAPKLFSTCRIFTEAMAFPLPVCRIVAGPAATAIAQFGPAGGRAGSRGARGVVWRRPGRPCGPPGTEAMDQAIAAIGVMSGTSMDGIDVAVVETDGDGAVTAGPGRTYPYPAELRAGLLALLADPARAQLDPLEELERAVTDAHVDAIRRFMADFAIGSGAGRLIGLHGQTVYHRPEARFTRQLGLGDRVAARLGIDTICRFRHADVASGREGAP